MILETMYTFLKVYVIQQSIETALGNVNRSLSELIILVSAVLIYGLVVKFLNKCAQNRLAAKLANSLRADIFRNVIYDSGISNNIAAENLIPALTTELLQVEDNYIRKYMHMIQSALIFVTVTIFIFNINILVGIGIFLLSLTPLLSPLFLSKRAQLQQKIYNDANAKYVSSLNDIVRGLETIKGYNISDKVLELIKKDISKAEFAFAKARVTSYGAGILAHGMLHFVRILILVMLGLLTLNGIIAIGILIALIEMVDSYLQRADTLINNIGFIKSVKPVVTKVLDLAVNADDDCGHSSYGEVADFNEISLDNVSFSYLDSDFNLNITHKFGKGKKYLIVGKSGSGKSTILKLLTKEVSPTIGEVRVCGLSLQHINNKEWFEHISVIGQDVFLFNSTLLQNIDLNETGDLNRVENSIRLANLNNWVSTLSDGLDTKLGDNASLISGGERQRIAIARAIFKSNKLYLVDEATSSLDNTNASIIENILLEHAETLIMVSHRIDEETACRFDEILVVESGTVVEKGTFKDLMNRHSAFYDRFNFNISVTEEGLA